MSKTTVPHRLFLKMGFIPLEHVRYERDSTGRPLNGSMLAMGYWRKVVAFGWGRFRSRASWDKVVFYLAQSAALFLVLFFAPWFGEIQAEARLAAAGGVALLGSAFILLIWDILASPKAMHDALERTVAMHEETLGYHASQARHEEAIIALYREGEAIYQAESDYEKWRDGMLAWNERVRLVLRRYYDPKVLYEYDNAEGRGVRAKFVEIKDDDEKQVGRGEYNHLFTAWLTSVDKIIRMRTSASAWMDFDAMKRLVPGTETPEHLLLPGEREK